MKLTMEQIQKLYDEPDGEPDIYYSEIDSLGRWADSKGTHPMQKLYYAITTAYVLGVKRGKAYEKQKKRFCLTADEKRQAEAIAKKWRRDEDMSSIMDSWKAEDVARVLLDAALTEETERQRNGSLLCGIRKGGLR